MAVQFTAPFGGLIGNKVMLAKFGSHHGNDMAVTASADRIFSDRKFGGKRTADRIIFGSYGRYVAEQIIQLF